MKAHNTVPALAWSYVLPASALWTITYIKVREYLNHKPLYLEPPPLFFLKFTDN